MAVSETWVWVLWHVYVALIVFFYIVFEYLLRTKWSKQSPAVKTPATPEPIEVRMPFSLFYMSCYSSTVVNFIHFNLVSFTNFIELSRDINIGDLVIQFTY